MKINSYFGFIGLRNRFELFSVIYRNYIRSNPSHKGLEIIIFNFHIEITWNYVYKTI